MHADVRTLLYLLFLFYIRPTLLVCNILIVYRTRFRQGTFFGGSHLSLHQIAMFVNLWADNVPLEFIIKTVRISSKTAVDWASFCREVVLDAMITRCEPIGGEGKIVEIDESKFGKRKYNRGHRIEGQWVSKDGSK